MFDNDAALTELRTRSRQPRNHGLFEQLVAVHLEDLHKAAAFMIRRRDLQRRQLPVQGEVRDHLEAAIAGIEKIGVLDWVIWPTVMAGLGRLSTTGL
jgi:Tfp pilus assembly protein PilO